MRPKIGITMDLQASDPDFPEFARYRVTPYYSQSVYAAGGLPILIPLIEAAMGDYLHECQGFIFTGATYAYPKEWYDSEPSPYVYKPRIKFEIALMRRVLAEDKPLLGICGGMQLLSGYYGGKMSGSVPASPGVAHRDTGHIFEPGHEVLIEPGTLLQAIVGKASMGVNSLHHERVTRVGPGVVLSGRAKDGVIEAVEMPEKTFVLGVQWHPETLADTNADNARLFKALVDAAKRR